MVHFLILLNKWYLLFTTWNLVQDFPLMPDFVGCQTASWSKQKSVAVVNLFRQHENESYSQAKFEFTHDSGDT